MPLPGQNIENNPMQSKHVSAGMDAFSDPAQNILTASGKSADYASSRNLKPRRSRRPPGPRSQYATSSADKRISARLQFVGRLDPRRNPPFSPQDGGLRYANPPYVLDGLEPPIPSRASRKARFA